MKKSLWKQSECYISSSEDAALFALQIEWLFFIFKGQLASDVCHVERF